jgi:hypothetical protein
MEQLIPLEGASPTGLQAKQLMGLTVNAINELSDSDVMDFNQFYDELYQRAYIALVVDVQKVLTGYYRFPDGTVINGKFNINAKGITVITSLFQTGLATANPVISLQGYQSLYSQIVINHLQFYYSGAALSGNQIINLKITNTQSGIVEVIEFDQEVLLGINTIPVFYAINDQYIQHTIELDVPFFAELLSTTQNFYQGGSWVIPDASCRCSLGGDNGFITTQVSPGLNLMLTSKCSIDKFIALNSSLFMYQLYYSIGREFMKERIASDRINSYTVISIDRATQLLTAYEKDYIASLDSLRGINQIPEDGECFSCKSVLSVKNLIP